ncbi:MAG: hypothetical protein R3E48_23100 [Burkholderiaceae bacterium]
MRAGELRATLEFAGLWNGEAAADLDLAPVADVDATAVEALVTARLAARKARNFAESDRIRDQRRDGHSNPGRQGPHDRRGVHDMGSDAMTNDPHRNDPPFSATRPSCISP